MRRLWPLAVLVASIAASCQDLTGDWRNGKGSVLRLEQSRHILHGTFLSTVEIAEGTAGNGAVHIRGWFHDGMLSFSAKYPGSVVAFTGQCYGKGGNDTIHTSWILHSKQDACDDHWLATRIGQDKFVRMTPKSLKTFTSEDK